MWADAVLEGGGVRAIALVGALSVAEEKGYRWKRVAGVSAGAVVASFMSAGYSAAEIRKLMEKLDFSRFMKRKSLLRWPWIGVPVKIWVTKGLYPTDELETWIRDKLHAKGVDTFGDLEPEQLQVVTADITTGRVLVIPRDLGSLGINPADFSVSRAVSMSCTLPYFFEPATLYEYDGRQRMKHTILDGGLLSNFPVWLFDVEGYPQWPTFGFRLVSDEWGQPLPTDSLLDFSIAIVKTMTGGMDNIIIPEKDLIRSILIPTGDVKATDFNVSKEKKQALYHSGEKVARDFFSRWDFRAYCNKYRNLQKDDNIVKYKNKVHVRCRQNL